MNKISIRKSKSVSGVYNSQITLTPATEKILGKTLKGLLEIEIMQGERIILESGEIQYNLNIDKEKVDIIMRAFNQVFFKHKQNNN